MVVRQILENLSRFRSTQKLARGVAHALRLYYRGTNNFERNGELRVLRILGNHYDDSAVLVDVGANKGEWAASARRVFPSARIYCLEPVPQTAKLLTNRFAADPNITVLKYGLSNRTAELEMILDAHDDTIASVHGSPIGQDTSRTVCRFRSGETFMEEEELNSITLLKIDVEGHEKAVIAGFASALQAANIDVIQFEYGPTFVLSRTFMRDCYLLLSENGFKVGRIFPKNVWFFEYVVSRDEQFFYGNFIAVHKRCASLIGDL